MRGSTTGRAHTRSLGQTKPTVGRATREDDQKDVVAIDMESSRPLMRGGH